MWSVATLARASTTAYWPAMVAPASSSAACDASSSTGKFSFPTPPPVGLGGLVGFAAWLCACPAVWRITKKAAKFITIIQIFGICASTFALRVSRDAAKSCRASAAAAQRKCN